MAIGRIGQESIKKFAWLLISFSFLLFIWAWLFRHLGETMPPRLQDSASYQANVLAAASLSLVAVTTIFVIAGYFGWGMIIDFIRERVDDRFRSHWEKQLEGYIGNALGYIIGEMAISNGNNREQLDLAIKMFTEAREKLAQIKSIKEKTACNNIVFYMTRRGRAFDEDYVLELAKTLRAGNEFTYMDLTYCGAILKYSRDDTEKRQARNRLQGLLDAGELKSWERKEAEAYLSIP